ncbi:hypothetical protein LPB19_02825 [Marinobacter salinisoli]|uniref:Uncharacterized protein n=1 Tax=Marinobacter salinisoli TaxID=2769486 RepID=A0ABX7MV45_9GAMM|nr:hypothetical protein [Marinobacter salinisoli]QSP95372.1 hypothetical protein LPB19_02825 [Marinobacter salinisoli]
MKRLFLVVLVLAVAGVAVANYRITAAVSEGLDLVRMQLAPVAEFQYQDVSTTLAGDIEVANPRFVSRASSQVISAEKIALKTGSLWALLNLKDQFQSGQIPGYLGLSVNGLNTDLAFMSAIEQAGEGENPYSRLETAGCGDRGFFGRADLVQMGYDHLVLDMDLAYRISKAGDQLTVSTSITSRDQTAMALDMVAAHPDSFLSGMLSAQAAQSARLESASITVTDLGQLNRMIDFCAGEQNMEAEAFRAHHLQAWIEEWRALGLTPSDSLVEVYQDFVSHPGSTLTFQINPFPSLELGDHYLSPDPVYLSGRLNPMLGTERTGLREVAVGHADTSAPGKDRASTPAVAQQAVKSAPEAKTDAAKPTASAKVIALSELSDHLNHDVQIRLDNGRTVKGRIEAVGGSDLHLKRFMHGGIIVAPIALNEIHSVTRL